MESENKEPLAVINDAVVNYRNLLLNELTSNEENSVEKVKDLINKVENSYNENKTCVNNNKNPYDLVLQLFKAYNDIVEVKRIINIMIINKVDINSIIDIDYTLLMLASLRGCLNICKELFIRGADVNIKNVDGLTALMIAASSNRLCIVEYLISCGAKVNARDNAGNTALYHASRQKNLEIVKKLVENYTTNADSNDEKLKYVKGIDQYGNNLIHKFINNNDVMQINILKGLLLSDLDKNIRNSDGITPLILAIIHNNIFFVKELISAGVDANFPDSEGTPPLIWAIQFNLIEIAKELISAGANIEIEITKGMDVVELGRRIKIKQFLEKYIEEKYISLEQQFLEVVEKGNLDKIRELINHGVKIDYQYGCKKDTALMIACIRGNIDTVELLISNKADLNLQDVDGRTALDHAINCANLEIMKKLINSGASLDIKNNTGKTTIMREHERSKVDPSSFHLKILEILEGPAKLLEACKNGHLNKVKKLVSNGVNINPIIGEIPLMVACENGHLEIVIY